MNIFSNRIRRPVERDGAAYYIFLTLLSFAMTVVAVRLFLQLTGYPQLGGKTLHIAHLLWGGLFLFGGALAMLILANRWVYRAGAVMTGVGVGLFIDEVGKFITRTNDYFYPPAAPIIYTFFLLVVLIYLQLRRKRSPEPRSELYRAFDMLEEVLEHDLDELEQLQLESRLQFVVANAEYPEYQHLAQDLLQFIRSEHIALVTRKMGWWERTSQKLKTWDERWITRRRLKAVLVSGLATLGVWSTQELVKSILGLFSPLGLEVLPRRLVILGRINEGANLGWLQTTISMQAGCGLVLLIGAILFILNRDTRAVGISFIGLLLFLTMANLLEFYVDQFSTIGPALTQLTLLLLLIHYRQRFVPAAL
ncbi:MAG TPA: hypothetical protein VGK00_11145 [Anaerolineales bacterium]|jgi:hypothetical protein